MDRATGRVHPWHLLELRPLRARRHGLRRQRRNDHRHRQRGDPAAGARTWHRRPVRHPQGRATRGAGTGGRRRDAERGRHRPHGRGVCGGRHVPPGDRRGWPSRRAGGQARAHPGRDGGIDHRRARLGRHHGTWRGDPRAADDRRQHARRTGSAGLLQPAVPDGQPHRKWGQRDGGVVDRNRRDDGSPHRRHVRRGLAARAGDRLGHRGRRGGAIGVPGDADGGGRPRRGRDLLPLPAGRCRSDADRPCGAAREWTDGESPRFVPVGRAKGRESPPRDGRATGGGNATADVRIPSRACRPVTSPS